MRASAGEVARAFGQFADRALVEPVTITKYGREHLVLLSADEYARLKRRDRIAYSADQIPDDLAEAIAASEPSAESQAIDKTLAQKTPK